MPVANFPLSLSTLADNGVRTEGVAGVKYDGNVVALRNVQALDGTARNVASRLLRAGLPEVGGAFAGAFDLAGGPPVKVTNAYMELESILGQGGSTLEDIVQKVGGALMDLGLDTLVDTIGPALSKMVGDVVEGIVGAVVGWIPVVGQLVTVAVNVIRQVVGIFRRRPDAPLIFQFTEPTERDRFNVAEAALSAVQAGSYDRLFAPPGRLNTDIHGNLIRSMVSGVIGDGRWIYGTMYDGQLGSLFSKGQETFGYVPGSGTLHIGYSAGREDAFDLGVYYPTTASICQQAFQQAQNVMAPQLWGVRARSLRQLWMEYLAQLRGCLSFVWESSKTGIGLLIKTSTKNFEKRVDDHLEPVRRQLAGLMHEQFGLPRFTDAEERRLKDRKVPALDLSGALESCVPVRALDTVRRRQIYAAQNLITVAYAAPSYGDWQLEEVIEAGKRDLLESPSIVHVEPELIPPGNEAFADELRRRRAVRKMRQLVTLTPGEAANAPFWSLFRAAPDGAARADAQSAWKDVANQTGHAPEPPPPRARDKLGRFGLDASDIPQTPGPDEESATGPDEGSATGPDEGSATGPDEGSSAGSSAALLALLAAAGVGGAMLLRK